MDKTCTRCKTTKSLDDFHKNKRNKDNRYNTCKICRNSYYKDHQDEIRARMTMYYKDNRLEIGERARIKRYSNIERYQKVETEYRNANRDKINKNNKTRLTCENKVKREKRLVKKRETMKRWRNKNPHKRSMGSRSYYLAKKQRTPAWLTTNDHLQILIIYAIATSITRVMGIQFVVDHIVPLRGTCVSGLHVPDNLQIITARDNSIKGNR